MVEKAYYSVKEAAKILDVSERTIYRYIDEKIISAIRRGTKGAYRIPGYELPAYKRGGE